LALQFIHWHFRSGIKRIKDVPNAAAQLFQRWVEQLENVSHVKQNIIQELIPQ